MFHCSNKKKCSLVSSFKNSYLKYLNASAGLNPDCSFERPNQRAFLSWSKISSEFTDITVIYIVGFSRDYVIISIPVAMALTTRPKDAVIRDWKLGDKWNAELESLKESVKWENTYNKKNNKTKLNLSNINLVNSGQGRYR